MTRKIAIEVPCSTSNIGPGFDVLGIALSLVMTVEAVIPSPSGAFAITYEGDSPSAISSDPFQNLITKTAMQVAGSLALSLPHMSIHIRNPIPLGRGLGSSGAAVVAGVVLASEALNLGFNTQRILDYSLAIEGHPDNISASILGGFVASYVRQSPDEPLEVSLPRLDTPWSLPLPNPPQNFGQHVRLNVSDKIKFVVVIPEFEVATKLARSVLPSSYSRSDLVFNLQRVSVLVASLSSNNLDARQIAEAMQDKIHQEYRQHLVPGLAEILALAKGCGKPGAMPGLLGVCLSGAGPTVLALATENCSGIAAAIQDIFAKHNDPSGDPIKSSSLVLNLSSAGLTIKSE